MDKIKIEETHCHCGTNLSLRRVMIEGVNSNGIEGILAEKINELIDEVNALKEENDGHK